MITNAKIPYPTIERIVIYSRPLEDLLEKGIHVISSEKLSEICHVNPAQIRKDLAYFGDFGVRGVGYDVQDLLKGIKSILATDRDWLLCIVGVGNLGKALLENEHFRKRGYQFAAAFDSDPLKVGTELPCKLVVEPTTNIFEKVRLLSIEIGVITTPPDEGQRAADLLMDAGVKAILNFAPIHIRNPECCKVANIDFTVNLENIAYHLSKV